MMMTRIDHSVKIEKAPSVVRRQERKSLTLLSLNGVVASLDLLRELKRLIWIGQLDWLRVHAFLDHRTGPVETWTREQLQSVLAVRLHVIESVCDGPRDHHFHLRGLSSLVIDGLEL